MKKLLINVICLVFILPTIKSQEYNKELDSLQIIKMIEKLRTSYLKAINNDTIEYMIEFFEIFPNNFSLYTQIYDCNKVVICGEQQNTLCYESHSHFKFLYNLRHIINKEDYYKKIIKLGINGYWDADAINDLQHCIYKCINENLPLTIETLKSFTDDEIESFWYFIYDGPLRTEKLPVDIESIRKLDKHIADLAKKALDRAKKNVDENGVYKFRN
ncbi:hypothetical protein KBH77_04760 [Patescibacteria group bacterium]|nr:hypothetical protein [Patescibacteria group bacterium]